MKELNKKGGKLKQAVFNLLYRANKEETKYNHNIIDYSNNLHLIIETS